MSEPVVAGFSRQTPKSGEARRNSTREVEPTRERCKNSTREADFDLLRLRSVQVAQLPPTREQDFVNILLSI